MSLTLILLASALSINATALVPAQAAQKGEHVISGKVTGQARKPVEGASVELKTSRGTVLGSATTDREGEFSIAHDLSKECSLEVTPDRKSGLATALIENIPGDVTRSFIVPLKHGFVVSGRVMHGDKGLKGLSVKVISIDAAAEHQTVHDGGSAKTARNGSFDMILTPGTKRIVVHNDRYEDLAAQASIETTVTADVTLPDIKLSERK